MRVDGLYFDDKESKKMLKQIRASIPEAERKKLMPIVKNAMNDSAGRGFGGEPNSTSIIKIGGYKVTANVCCGGYAEVDIVRVSPEIPVI